MLDHHLQRSIVYRLAQTPSLRFSDLKPDVVDNKLFTYHLKKVVSAGYITKTSDGGYSLTPKGRRLGTRVFISQQALVDRADSVLFLGIKRSSDGAWLLYKRGTYPLLEKIGFMHATPNSLEDAPVTAHRTLKEKTGLSGTFTPLGGGYFRVYEKDNLESFTHFTLLECQEVSGELVQNDPHAEYFWDKSPDFKDQKMLPNMELLAELLGAHQPFFIERTLHV